MIHQNKLQFVHVEFQYFLRPQPGFWGTHHGQPVHIPPSKPGGVRSTYTKAPPIQRISQVVLTYILLHTVYMQYTSPRGGAPCLNC